MILFSAFGDILVDEIFFSSIRVLHSFFKSLLQCLMIGVKKISVTELIQIDAFWHPMNGTCQTSCPYPPFSFPIRKLLV